MTQSRALTQQLAFLGGLLRANKFYSEDEVAHAKGIHLPVIIPEKLKFTSWTIVSAEVLFNPEWQLDALDADHIFKVEIWFDDTGS